VLGLVLPRSTSTGSAEVGGAIALFAVFVVGGELISIPPAARQPGQGPAVTTTFAYGLVPLAGTAVAVLVLHLRLGRGRHRPRQAAVKILFNAAQYVLALAAGGAVYAALGGGYEITTGHTLPPWPPAAGLHARQTTSWSAS
jgi:hypothetical protein